MVVETISDSRMSRSDKSTMVVVTISDTTTKGGEARTKENGAIATITVIQHKAGSRTYPGPDLQ